MAERILVTGATGFVGRHALSPLARAGFDVHAVARAVPDARADVTWHAADLLDDGAAAALVSDVRATHLLHFAWIATPHVYWTSEENLRWLAAGEALVRRFAEMGGRRVVVAGSCAEYDWRYGFCSEGLTPLGPRELYGRCKNNLRESIERTAEGTALSAAWGRMFWTFGPHEPSGRLVPDVIAGLMNAEVVECSSGEQYRDFLFVPDAAAAFAALAASPVRGPVNVASGRPTAVRDVVSLLAAAFGRPDLIRWGARPAGDEAPLVVADVRRLRREVGYRPATGLEDALAATVAWWRGARSGQEA